MKKITQGFSRFVTIDAAIDSEARTVRAALSSETPTREYFGQEVLKHDADSIDLSRAADGLPMLFNHDPNQPIGVIRDLAIEDGVLRGTLHFSRNARASEIWADVEAGFLRNMSVSGERLEWTEHDFGIITTKWAILEGSVVSVPADASVGINRNHKPEGLTMGDNNTPEDNNASDSTIKVVEFQRAREDAKKQGLDEGAKIERARQDGIRTVFAPFQGEHYNALRDTCIEKGSSIEQARAALLDLIGTGAEPVMQEPEPTMARGHVRAGEDQADKFARGVTDALMFRGGLLKREKTDDDKIIRDIRRNEFASMTLYEIAREYLLRNRVDVRGFSRKDLIGEVMIRRALPGHGTSDFPGILENIANKAAMIGYEEAGETWDRWVHIGSLSDFRPASRAGLSSFSDLELVREDGEFKYGTFGDRKETITLATYGKLFSISRQALINDDLSELTKIPRKMGIAANRKIGDLAYAVLTSNPTLGQDGVALFHASHNNLAGTPAALAVATFEDGEVAMATQTDEGSAVGLNITPAYLLVPWALRGTANVLMTAQYDPAATAGTLTPNTAQGKAEVIADARLDAASATAWYLAANPNMADTIEVAFLDGDRNPRLEQQQEWTRDGTSFKVAIDACAAALGYQGLYKNAGA